MNEVLTPSFHGEKCGHNGRHIDFELACDECNFYSVCFPDWAAANSADYLEATIQTASAYALKTFLQAHTAKNTLSDEEKKIVLQVMQELYRRKDT